MIKTVGLIALLLFGVLIPVLSNLRNEPPPASVAGREAVVLLHKVEPDAERDEGPCTRCAQKVTRSSTAVIHRGRVTSRAWPNRCSQGSCRAARCGAVHVVTHSMGGLLVRAYLREHTLPHLRRVVMLAPPNQGSEVVDRLAGWRLLLDQRPGRDASSEQVPRAWLAVWAPDFELGVIAGDRSVNPLLAADSGA